MADSIYKNSGRGCINCSGVWASRNTEEIAGAIAEKSGKKLWGSLLYLVEYDKSLEKDVQDCFITSLDLNKQKTRLEVTSEAGNLYYLNLKTLKVIHVMRR